MLFLHLVLLCFTLTCGLNLDIQNAKVYQAPRPSSSRQSYFGYSVALDSSASGSVVLVGAPRANSTVNAYSKVNEPGVIYVCFVNSKNRCSEWRYSLITSGDSRWNERKNNAWMGATIQVERNGTLATVAFCGPRWSFDTKKYGICYSTTVSSPNSYFDAKEEHVYFPSFHFNEMCGYSMFLDRTDHTLVMGSYRSLYDYSYYEANQMSLNYVDYYYDKYNTTNFGYSVTKGYFYRRYKNKRMYLAVGVPRGMDMKGKVRIYSTRDFVQQTMVGSQIGEYFGSSLAACDVNGDNRDDLLVGAPLWSKSGDEGRIAVYSTKSQLDFKEKSIKGKSPGARFGSAIACLGDLDRDGYFDDVAVGAPYEDGHGAVYIFNGGPDGLTTYSQRILGSEFRGGLKGFGVSFSGPRDVDGNGYHDLVVGAYLSGHAVLLPSRPVVGLRITRLALAEGYSLKVVSEKLEFVVCADYVGRFASRSLDVNISVAFDKRVSLKANSQNTYNSRWTLPQANKEICVNVTTLIDASDLLKPIKAVANISLSDNRPCSNCPVVQGKRSKLYDILEEGFQLGCKNSTVCETDLQVKIHSHLGPNNSFVISSKSNVILDIQLLNTQEPAYYGYLDVVVPNPILVYRLPSTCYDRAKLNPTSNVIHCKLGNPLLHEFKLSIELDMSAVGYDDRMSKITAKTGSLSIDKNQTNNEDSLKIIYLTNASVALNGKASEGLLSYLEVEAEDQNIESIAFEQIYEIQKFGVSPIGEVSFHLTVPTHWKDVKIVTIEKIESQYSDGQYRYANEESLNFTDAIYEFYKDENITLPSFENQTYYLNCTNGEIVCQTFPWTVGPFRTPQSSVKITVNFKLSLSNQMAATIREKDLLFVSEASVEITIPNVTIESREKRPIYKYIPISFVYRPKPRTVALWIIVLSVLLGLVLVSLAGVMLYKLGFFKRKRIGDGQRLTSQDISVREVTEEDFE